MKADAIVEPGAAYAHVGGLLATDLVDVSTTADSLDEPGFHVVVGTFEGRWATATFRHVVRADAPVAAWAGPTPDTWESTMRREEYTDRVRRIREQIAAGTVYQVNLCRVLRAPLDDDADLTGLSSVLAGGNPAPFSARVYVPEAGLDVASASPELFLRRDGRAVASSPIKGTGRTSSDLSDKDVAENVMIVDLVRNDLGRVCRPGTVAVRDALAVHAHPGLVHLVSTVTGELDHGVGWTRLLEATFPPGSVSGAPKSTALAAIEALEPTARGPYCGAIGWVDGAAGRGELAVGIRTFWRADGSLYFGTGAGITWGSDPDREWEETELKASRLLGLASTDGRRR